MTTPTPTTAESPSPAGLAAECKRVKPSVDLTESLRQETHVGACDSGECVRLLGALCAYVTSLYEFGRIERRPPQYHESAAFVERAAK